MVGATRGVFVIAPASESERAYELSQAARYRT